jgi:hydroxymethylglutaryl-CoA reductase
MLQSELSSDHAMRTASAMPAVPALTRASSGPTSALAGFHRLPMAQRRALIAQLTGLSDEDLRVLSGDEGLCAEQAEHMVENVIGILSLPLGLCVNLRVDGRDRLVPMVVEEASVVAAASHAAKLLRAGGGVTTSVSAPRMIGQIQVMDVPDRDAAEAAVLAARDELLAAASRCDPCLVRNGGGAVDLSVRHLGRRPTDPVGPMLVVHLVVDVREAMGANTVNGMCEKLAPRIEQLTRGRVRLRIVSNLADLRTVRVEGRIPLAALEGKGCGSGRELAAGVEEASVFAERDPYRAATHNKGIMNGVDAVLLAFGQDWRAAEAGAHAYAARDGHYAALATWRLGGDSLRGRLELPMPVGVVGGVNAVHPSYGVARKLSQIATAAELASVAAAVGLAQNLGALRALAAEGIQRGHMRIHARNLAVSSGAVDHEVEVVAERISSAGPPTREAARETLRRIRSADRLALDPTEARKRFLALGQSHVRPMLDLLDDVVRGSSGDGSSLTEMCAYHLGSGGKRLRAILPLSVADALGTDPGRLLPFAAACEMLHNATLVHDDLQDGDSLRRGSETVWHRFGAPQAINLGDAMFYYTLLLLERLQVPAARRQAIVHRTVRDTLQVIGGQERELALGRMPVPTLEGYFAMVVGKTSGLFALPMAGAAALCGASTQLVQALGSAAQHLGVLFQIQDDLLDLYGPKGREAAGNDIREGKRSVLAVHTLLHAPPDEAARLREILDRDRQSTTAAEVAEAMALFERHGAPGFAAREIAQRRRRAIRAIAEGEHPALVALVDAVAELLLEPIAPVMARLEARA